MRLLLDTQVFLWSLAQPEKLSTTARSAIEDGSNAIFVSAATAWEIAIKVGLGRLKVPGEPRRFVPDQIARNAFLPLAITVEHALAVGALRDHHHDPFDRLLIAQATAEGLAIVSADRALRAYDVEVVW